MNWISSLSEFRRHFLPLPARLVRIGGNHVGDRNVPLERELVGQRRLTDLPRTHHRFTSPLRQDEMFPDTCAPDQTVRPHPKMSMAA